MAKKQIKIQKDRTICCSDCFCNKSHGSGTKFAHCEKVICECHKLKGELKGK